MLPPPGPSLLQALAAAARASGSGRPRELARSRTKRPSRTPFPAARRMRQTDLRMASESIRTGGELLGPVVDLLGCRGRDQRGAGGDLVALLAVGLLGLGPALLG